MAVCEIWDVKGRLDHPIDYAENPEKTANPKYTEADLQALAADRLATSLRVITHCISGCRGQIEMLLS